MLSGEQRNFCIGVRQDYDVLLRTVLNKSIDSLTRGLHRTGHPRPTVPRRD